MGKEKRLIQLDQAVLLGVVQGLTEFLPVSSDGHLVIFQHLLGLTESQLLLDVMLHLGTLVAVLVVFRDDLILITRALFRAIIGNHSPPDRNALRLMFLVITATFPTAIIGLVFKELFESLFASLVAAGAGLLVTGTILWASRYGSKANKGIDKISFMNAFIIGVCQSVAILPGVSRSGTTISVALMMGVERGLAARFSFLLAIPAILGAGILQVGDLTTIEPGMGPVILAGVVISALVGYVALKILLRVLIAGNFSLFAHYCWVVGLLTLAAAFYG